MLTRFPRLLRFLAVATGLLAPAAAGAHPHVWVVAKAELLYGPDGRVTGVRHHWTFDEGYSAVAVQGLDTNGDGRTTPDELAELAKVNTSSLSDFAYFTSLKAAGAKQRFGEPVAERMSFDDGRLTLGFDLPLGAPVPGRLLVLDVYDPTFFVDFRLADGDDAVTLAGAPAGCTVKVSRPKPAADAGKPMSESFYQSLTASSAVAAQFSSRAMAVCP